jgi:RNA polymerase sigma-B factor
LNVQIEVRRFNEGGRTEPWTGRAESWSGCSMDVVLVGGTFAPHTAPRLRAVLAGRLAEGRVHLVVDLARTRMFDARAAGVLAAAAARAQAVGGSLSAVATPGVCRDVLAIVGRASRLMVYDDPSPVLASVGILSTVDEQRWPGSRDITVHALLAGCAMLPDCSADRTELRRLAIEHGMPLARRLARRFRDRGEPGEDLTQVAMVGLVNAVDGYDPGRGNEFAGYATPTIVGELRRYFRDKGWRIRVPRRLQELRLRVNQATADLTQARGATPTKTDIAKYLSISEADVAEAIEVGLLYHPLSLSAPGAPGTDLDLVDPLGEDDPAIEVVDQRESVRPLLATLPERERAILSMRFFGDMTQSQIADRLGISQMHVSRLLSQTLGSLRAALAEA